MHLPHLSPTGLVDRTSTGDSMDDDSSRSVMGYGNPYLASGMPREIGNNLTEDPDATYRYVGKLNAQQQDTNGWKMDKLCDGRTNDCPGLGDWLAGEEDEEGEGKEDINADTEEDDKITVEDGVNTDEDKFSTEGDTRDSEECDSSTEDTAKESGDEEKDAREEVLLPGEEYLTPSWVDLKNSSQKELQPKRKLLWGSEEEGSVDEEHWPISSNGETEPSQTEEEEETEEEEQEQVQQEEEEEEEQQQEKAEDQQQYKITPEQVPPDTSSGSPRACPVLCFDEYGNLTTSYQDPGIVEMREPFTSFSPVCATNKKCDSFIVDSPPDTILEPKVLRSRTRLSSQENTENGLAPVVVSEQELKHAFKDFNTAATSRYGRARKRKTVDGFFFGTINFNELRKITSGSPKKSGKGSSKNASPEQKTKAKEEGLPNCMTGMEVKDFKDLNENGIGTLDGHHLNGEIDLGVPPLGTVQIDQAKDSFIVQSRDMHAREEKMSSRRRRSAPAAPLTTNPTSEKEAAKTDDQEGAVVTEALVTRSIDNRGRRTGRRRSSLTRRKHRRGRSHVKSIQSIQKTQTATQPPVSPQPQVSPRSEVSPQPQISSQPQESPQPQVSSELQIEPKLQASPEPQITLRSQASPRPRAASQSQAEPQSQATSKSQASPKPQTTPQLQRSSRSATLLAIQAAIRAAEESTNQQSAEELMETDPVKESVKENVEDSKASSCDSDIDGQKGTTSLTSTENQEVLALATSSKGQESCTSLEHSEGQECMVMLTKTDSCNASDVKAAEEISSITKSGRIIKKPQLMDISNEEKRQKETREQLRQTEALMNSYLEEEMMISSANMQLLEKEHPCQYMVGDLVWVHIRGSPLWPSMISYDPELGQYSRVAAKLNQYTNRYSGIRMYHVQFFSDNALTHWIAPASMVPYDGYDKLNQYLLELKEKMKEKSKHRRVQCEGFLKTLLHIKKVSAGQKHERWMMAISEANVAHEMDRYERIQKYTFKCKEKKDKGQTDTYRGGKLSTKGHSGGHNQTSDAHPDKKKRGRPKKHSPGEPVSQTAKTGEDSTDGEFSGFDDTIIEGRKNSKGLLTSRLPRKKSEFMMYAQQHLESFMQENPDLTEEVALSKLRWRWRKVTSTQGGRHKGRGGKRKYQRSAETSNDLEEEESGTANGSAKRQRLEEEGGKGVYKVVRNEKVCCRCEGVSVRAGGDMVRCKGLCCGVFHLSCLGLTTMPRRDFKCEECLTERHPCFICKSSAGSVHRCTIPFCGKFYHDDCVQRWPQVSKQRQQEKFVCPRHICHMCAANADDVADSIARTPPFTRCLRCPTTYHIGEGCMAAGTEEVSQSNHICTKHLQLPKNITHHVNVNWCFCCSKGGSLLLCDQCPAAFHAECMKITTPEGGYVCEDCENGKFPVYGDVVWVKLGLYRWWPGQVLHPRFIPDNIENLPHQQGMFCVLFFGSNDYYWVTRGRAFLYQEGDKGSRAQSSRTLEIQFRRAVDEALEAYREQRTKRNQQELRWSEKGNLKPPPYVRIDANRPVGNVRLSKVDLAAVNRCDCEPNSDNPCGSDEKCLNRMLMFECMREVCGAGDRCGNQRFQKKKYPNVCCFKTEDRGWGLKTVEDIKKGEFVIEYVGELIDDEEFRRRIEEMHDVKEENYYFLTIDKDIMIDAGPKGNLARFMNHSCQPNCETQKWTVGGDTRVGLFAIENVPAGSELTFNYNLQCVGTEKKRCCCGAANCSGFIGVKVQKTDMSGPKREKGKQRRKRRRKEIKLSEDECFRCGSPGDLILCDGVDCPKGYHLECLGLDKLPRGKWICPWHHCDECGQWSTRLNRCNFCPNSYCRQHVMSNLQHLAELGNVCQDHDAEELDTLKNQMETAAIKVEEQQNLNGDAECGPDRLLDSSPGEEEAAEAEEKVADVVEKEQKETTNYRIRHKPRNRRVPSKSRRGGSRSGQQRKRIRNKKLLQSTSRRNREI